jgi:hypothetical protein
MKFHVASPLAPADKVGMHDSLSTPLFIQIPQNIDAKTLMLCLKIEIPFDIKADYIPFSFVQMEFLVREL